ncbi:MAG: cation:proton antiporter [Acidimicrobiia bacterium]|nr:cation:proton antiporter [Acidimicrobiia bacterium]
MHEQALLWLELGGLVLGLALLARVATAVGLSPIPLYLVGGLAVGEGGLIPLVTSEDFIATGADLGVILLLLMLGLEYTPAELRRALRSGAPAGLLDLLAGYTPGLAAGLLLGLGPVPSLFLGGVTYISSSGVVAKLVADLGWVANRETPVVLSLLVFEDLAMAVLLPVLAVVALGGSPGGALLAVAAALALVAIILTLASRHGEKAGRLVFSGTDEVNLLTLVGVTLVVAGFTEQLNVSAAVGAFLVGIGISGEAAHRARALLTPLRDLFAAVFFVFFGLSTDPAAIPAALAPAAALAAVSALTKFGTGWWAARRAGVGRRGRARAGAALIARGEFSVIIAGLGAAAAGAGSSRLGPLAAVYVLLTATLGPLAARFADRAPGGPPARWPRIRRRAEASRTD